MLATTQNVGDNNNKEAKERWIFGWATDRTPEPGLVHTWATANVAEFLVEYRAFLQEQVNTLLRMRFLSYHPNDLEPMDQFSPPDLIDDYKDRLSTQLWVDLIKMHKARALRETHWIPQADYAPRPVVFSAILAGPPGSAKSYLARCIAGELGWPLIALSPSDFLSAGEAGIEARAREIFMALGSGSRLVYFFDEIDELIFDRESDREKASNRSVFSFLTPSFLTKLQDLRDAAKQKSFIFLIGTNYLDHIDAAAKRSGRIDREFMVIYPDEESRMAFIVDDLKKQVKREALGKKDLQEFLTNISSSTALFSVPGLIKLCQEIAKNIPAEKANIDLEPLNRILKNVKMAKGNFKPELDLRFYWKRPAAAKEWAIKIPSSPTLSRRQGDPNRSGDPPQV